MRYVWLTAKSLGGNGHGPLVWKESWVPTPVWRGRLPWDSGQKDIRQLSHVTELCCRDRPRQVRQNQEVLSPCSIVWSGHTIVSGKFRAGASRKATHNHGTEHRLRDTLALTAPPSWSAPHSWPFDIHVCLSSQGSLRLPAPRNFLCPHPPGPPACNGDPSELPISRPALSPWGAT